MRSNRRASPSRRPAARALVRAAGAERFAGPAVARSPRAAHVVRPGPRAGRCRRSTLVDLAGKPLAPRGARRPGRRAQLLGDLVRAVPARDAVARAMAARRRREGVVVAAVNYKEAPDVIRRFLERAPFESPILLDRDGDATVGWTPRVFPSTVLDRSQRPAGARRRRRARLGRRRGQGAARAARRCLGPGLAGAGKPSPDDGAGARR